MESTSVCARPAAGIGRWIKEPFCGLSHGGGAVLAVVGLVFLLVYARSDAASIVGVSIYGASLILLFTASAIVHSVHCSRRVENVLERLDYAAIFFLIAGTYTPICLKTLSGPWGWTLLAIEWSLALIGATAVLVSGPRRHWVMLYVPMGWMVLVAIAPLMQRLHTEGLIWLLVGGVIYTVGAVVFVSKRPRLWPGRFDYHDLWHTLVLLAAACHFTLVAQVTGS